MTSTMHRIVHDVVRRNLDRFAAALASSRESERQRAGQLAEASRFLRTMLTLHHEGEDKIRCKHGTQRCDHPPTPPVSFAAPGLRLSNTGGDWPGSTRTPKLLRWLPSAEYVTTLTVVGELFSLSYADRALTSLKDRRV